MENQQDKIKTSFTREASKFADPRLTLSNAKYLKWITDRLPLNNEMNVLDVACGTGILTRTLAPLVRSVIGIDVTPAMLSQARVLAANQDLLNIEFRECPAENTRFSSGIFDLSVTRFSLHHFENPIVQVHEMVRVTRNDGCVAIIDLVSPSDSQMAVRYNEYERLRDPSHTVALSKQGLEELVEGARLTIHHLEQIQVPVNVAHWLNLTRPSADIAERIVSDLEAEIEGRNQPTGLAPSRDEAGQLIFQQQWLMIVTTKK